MTQNQFATYHYRHSEVMIWHTKHPDHDIECMLVGVDFEGEMFRLVPLDLDWYEDKEYWVNKALKTVNAKDASYQDNYKGDYWTTFRRTNRTHEHRVMKEFAKAMGYEYTKKKTK